MDFLKPTLAIKNTTKCRIYILQGTNISRKTWHFEDDFPFPKVGYVNFPGGYIYVADPSMDPSSTSAGLQLLQIFQLQDRNTKLHGMETSWHAECLEFVGRCLGGGERVFFFHIFLKKAPQNFTHPPKTRILKLRTTQLIMENHLRISTILGFQPFIFQGLHVFVVFLPVNPNISFFKAPTCIDWHR